MRRNVLRFAALFPYDTMSSTQSSEWRCIRRPNAVGANRRWCAIHAGKEMVDECANLSVSRKEYPISVLENAHPIFLARFLISTHYTKYDPLLFGINFAACLFVLFPKLPIVSLGVGSRTPLPLTTWVPPSAPPPTISIPPSRPDIRSDSNNLSSAESSSLSHR